jgi:hypothetical protein
MNDEYKIPPPEALEVSEPAVAYYPGVRAAEPAAMEPWMANITDDTDGINEFGKEHVTAPDGRYLADDDPEFREMVLRRADEAIARMKAGVRGRTTNEICDKLIWRIENNQWDDVKTRTAKWQNT